MSDKEYSSTTAGSTAGFAPEWHDGDSWVRVETRRGLQGVPSPLFEGGLLATVGLMGYAQANAIAWMFKAHADAEGEKIEIRVQEYEVTFDIRTKKMESGTEQESE